MILFFGIFKASVDTNNKMILTTMSAPSVLDKKEEIKAEDLLTSSSAASLLCGWRDALIPLILVLAAHLALGYVTELFHHRGAHVGLRE
jgi:hypothetical protein